MFRLLTRPEGESPQESFQVSVAALWLPSTTAAKPQILFGCGVAAQRPSTSNLFRGSFHAPGLWR
jgi:hypothetical protein